MFANKKALLMLIAPIALTLHDGDASARKKKKKPPVEETAPAAEQPATPSAPPTEPPPAGVSVGASVSVDASVTAPAAGLPAVPGVSADAGAVAAVPAPPPVKDGVRFRGGISIHGGGEFLDLTGGLGGIDGRIGVQINRLIGVYLQPHVSFGAAKLANGQSGATGNFAAAVMADVTLINRIFVGAGAGFGVINAPYGAMIGLRFGGYPIMKFSETKPRRKGLMVGIDLRTYIAVVPSSAKVLELMAGVGYEAF